MREENVILKIITRIIIVILLMFCIFIIIRMFCKNILIDMFGINNGIVKKIADFEETTTKKINFEEMYPFECSNKESKDNKENIIDKYTNIIDKVKSQLELYSSEYLFGYENITKIAKLYEKDINWYLIRKDNEDTPIKIANNNWISVKGKKDYTKVAENIIEFNNYLKEKNIEMLYVQAPNKLDNLTSGGMLNIYKDYLKENTDKMIDNLINNNIDVLDLREKISEENINNLDIFYKTDHHWKSEAGLWASKEIVNHINKKWNMNVDINLYNNDSYEYKLYKNAFLGSQARKVTEMKAKKEDFNLIIPKFENNLTVNIPDIDFNKTGTFMETLIDNELLDTDYLYTAYGHADRALIHTKNNMINSKDNVLLLKDSYGDVLLPYLALGLENIYEIDQRYFNGSIKSFIEKNNITKVILLYYPGSLHIYEEFPFVYE